MLYFGQALAGAPCRAEERLCFFLIEEDFVRNAFFRRLATGNLLE